MADEVPPGGLEILAVGGGEGGSLLVGVGIRALLLGLTPRRR